MRVIVLTQDDEDDEFAPIGVYSFEGFQQFLNNLMKQANFTWEERNLLVIEQNKNMDDMWGSLNQQAEYACTINYFKASDDKYHWCLNHQNFTHEQIMNEIELLMRYEDPKVKQLETEIEVYKKRLTELETQNRYMPDGQRTHEAKKHFYSLAEGD